MGYVFDFNDAKAYQKWFNDPKNRLTFEFENRLLFYLLKPVKNSSVLDIGCGIGTNILSFLEKGLDVTGIDPSVYMLDIASKNIGHSAQIHRCFGEDLPFDDNSFNYSCLITSLEFVDNPRKTIEEACRVAKDKLFIGFLNRYALRGIERRVKGIFSPTIYNKARFFSIWELKYIIKSLLGDVPIEWRTVCHLPSAKGKIGLKIENSPILQKCPFGAFAGIVVFLKPKFRTRPLELKYPSRVQQVT